MNHTHTRLITVGNVVGRGGVGGRSSLYEGINPKSPRYDPDIPKPIKIGRRTYFVEEEIEAWLRLKIEKYRAQQQSHWHPQTSPAAGKKKQGKPGLLVRPDG